jgi:hypothetical protein
MAESSAHQREQRREELAESLPALSQKRVDTYRLNSDALALNRTGVTHHPPRAMVRLEEDEVAADAAIRDAQRELRQLDAEINSASGGRRAGRAGRALFGRSH